MSFLNWIHGKIEHESQHPLHARIPPERTDAGGRDAPLKAGESYFRIFLAEMFLKHDKKWFTSQYPVVHSLVTLTLGSQPDVELVNVAGPLKLPDVSTPSLGKVVPLSFALTPLLPFGGGTVQIAAGLLALTGKNELTGFLKTMEQLTQVICVPQVSGALKLASVVSDGVGSLVQGSAGELHLGWHETFVSAGAGAKDRELRPGYVALVLATEQELVRSQLFVKGGQLCRGPSLAQASPLVGYTYMLFYIEARTERDDWEALSSIDEPFKKACALLVTDPAEAKARLETAILTAWESPDLTRVDRRRVAKLLREEYDARRQSLGLNLTPGPPPTLAATMAKGLPAERWSTEATPVTLAELLAP